jgi:predicted DCC family thiol-disulfide oxidoreductase YuxK
MSVSDNILLFDGVCNLCNGLVRFIIKRDRHARIKFAPLQSDSQYIASLLGKFDAVPVDMETVIYISGNKIFFKSSAILHVLKDIGGLWRLFYGFIIVPPVIRDFFYIRIARSRYMIFGKSDSCMVPVPEIEDRFII